MKFLKKTAGLLLALVLMASLCVPALAANDDYTITIQNENSAVSIVGATFSAYRIFEATYNPELDKIAYQYDPATCLPVAYNGKMGKDLLKWLGEADKVDGQVYLKRTAEEMRQFADYVYETYVMTGAATAAASVEAESETAVLTPGCPGYYLVYGTGTADDGHGAVAAAVSVDSNVRGVVVKPKFKAPTLEKVIFHNDKNVTGDWDAVGDFQIGDPVKFRLTATMPNIDGYSDYTYIVYDTMSPGITPDFATVDDFAVWIDGYGKDRLESNYLTLDMGEKDGNATFSLKIDIFKAMNAGRLNSNSVLYIYYQGILNSKAVETLDEPEFNRSSIRYSSNPYMESETQYTAASIVYAWTFDMGINKVDGENPAQKLTGAQFVLSKNPDLDISKLNIGTDGTPTVTGDLLGLVKSGSNYRIAEAGDTEISYIIDAGTARIAGLDDAVDYYLYETKSPAGYNLREEPVQLSIESRYSATGDILSSGYPQLIVTDGESVTASSSMATDVYNEAGTQLPITGGMGTTLFYIIGGVLVLGAAVLLITRRRMNMD